MHLVFFLFVLAQMAFVFFNVLKQFFMKMLDRAFVELNHVPGIENILKKLKITPYLLLIAAYQLLNG